MQWRYLQCQGFLSVRKNTVMQSPKIGGRKWQVANLKRVLSRKSARNLGIMQKSAWHINHRIRKAFEQENPELLGGILEVDKTHIGCKERNKHEWRNQCQGQGPIGKTAVVAEPPNVTAKPQLSLSL